MKRESPGVYATEMPTSYLRKDPTDQRLTLPKSGGSWSQRDKRHTMADEPFYTRNRMTPPHQPLPGELLLHSCARRIGLKRTKA
jgi:hypothetical protein